MLANRLYPALRLTCGLYATLATTNLAAADLSTLKAPTASHNGHVLDATPMTEGSYSLGLNTDFGGSVYFDAELDRDHALKEVLTYQTMLGMGLSENFSLYIGLGATKESADAASYIFAMKDRGDSDMSSQASGFSGATVTGKYRLFKSGLVGVAAAASVNSGSFDDDSFSLTRSAEPSGSWMLITTVGKERDLSLSFNTGFRYRFPERIGSHTFRNEWFYRGGMTSYITREFALFTSAEGRRIMHATDNGALESGSRRYRPLYGVGYHAGVKLDLDQVDISVFAGKARESSPWGQGTKTLGLSLNYTFGAAGSSSSKDGSEDIEIVDGMKKEMERRKKARGPLGEETPVDFVDDMKTTGMTGELDDFVLTDRKIKAEKAKYPAGTSADEKAEQELERVRRLKKVREERERMQMEREERRRAKEALEESQARNRAKAKWNEEIQEELREMPYITDEEVRWNGLE